MYSRISASMEQLMDLAKLKWAFAIVAIFGMTTIVCGADFGKMPAAGFVEPQPVLAPIKPSGLDAKIVEKYEKLGAFYGGFTAAPESPDCDDFLNQSASEIVFTEGEEAASNGLPGFCWYRLPGGKLPELPSVDRQFGIEIRVDINDVSVQKLSSLKNLDILILHSRKLTDAAVKELSSLKSLRSLTLFSDQLTDAAVKELVSLKNRRSLTLYANLTNGAVKDVASIGSLQHLALLSPRLTDAAIEDLVVLQNVQSLTLSARLSREGVNGLAALKNLKTLRLFNNAMIMTEVNIKELSSLKNLQSLNLQMYLTKGAFKELASLKNLRSLTVNGLRDTTVRDVASLENLENLTAAQAQGLTDDGVEELDSLKKLRSLTLNSLVLTVSGVRHIVSRHQNLESLVLFSQSGFDDVSLLKNLKKLSLPTWQLTFPSRKIPLASIVTHSGGTCKVSIEAE